MVQSVVQQQYDQLAKIYDQRWKTYIGNTLNFVNQWAAIPAEANVLDIACGTGEFERLLVQVNPNQQILGIDISTEMLAIAQQKLDGYASVKFEQGSATKIPAVDEQFDVVITSDSQHVVQQPNGLMSIPRRVDPISSSR